MDYAVLRKRMVDEQLRARGIDDEKVLRVFSALERHKFIPAPLRASAYADFPVPIAEGQTISQPYIVALMTQLLALSGQERILEIGTGSGFQAAVLSMLAKEVFSIERFEGLARDAQNIFKELGVTNVAIKVGDGTLGWPEYAPFDRIIITAASPRIPLPLTEQLKENGKMIIPLGETFSQVLTLLERKEGKLSSSNVCGCVFVPLVGKYGAKE